MHTITRIAAATIGTAGLALAGIAPASAAPARHRSPAVAVRVRFRDHGRTEIVTLTRDRGHLKVNAVGNCNSTGITDQTGRTITRPGQTSRITCKDWYSVGWWYWNRPWHAVYHAVRGNRNLY